MYRFAVVNGITAYCKCVLIKLRIFWKAIKEKYISKKSLRLLECNSIGKHLPSTGEALVQFLALKKKKMMKISYKNLTKQKAVTLSRIHCAQTGALLHAATWDRSISVSWALCPTGLGADRPHPFHSLPLLLVLLIFFQSWGLYPGRHTCYANVLLLSHKPVQVSFDLWTTRNVLTKLLSYFNHKSDISMCQKFFFFFVSLR